METGLHHELLSHGGLYKKLFEMQFNTQEKLKQEETEAEREKAEAAAIIQEPAIDLNEAPQPPKWS
ncbi:MAG: hypothetical protein IPI25_03110 [Candidatus Brocadia sp.]|nr:MAG: hypothetical protein IPI25_03110 [Candidatus Brocadia sp.]